VTTPTNSLHGRPTPTEMLAVVAAFLETQVLPAVADPYGSAEIGTAVYALRIIERELLEESPAQADARSALADLGFSDEAQLTVAIRDGELDDRTDDVASCLRTLVNGRLAIVHPGYQNE
jgi:Domain of unknown function (DUF6285)